MLTEANTAGASPLELKHIDAGYDEVHEVMKSILNFEN